MGFPFDHQHLFTSDLLFGGVSDILFHNTGDNAQLYAVLRHQEILRGLT